MVNRRGIHGGTRADQDIGNGISLHLEVLNCTFRGNRGLFDKCAQFSGRSIHVRYVLWRNALGAGVRRAASRGRHLPITAFHSLRR